MQNVSRGIVWGRRAVMLAAILFAHAALAFTPSDPFFTEQWYLTQIQAPRAWDVAIGNLNSIVAVLDVGVDTNHPDLQGAMWVNEDEIAGNGIDDDANGFIDDIGGWDFIDSDADPQPALDVVGAKPQDLHHGTLVSGLIAARGNNNIGIAGVDWLARIMPLRVLNASGTGTVDTVVAGIDYAVANGANIINLSFAGNQRSIDLEFAIKRAADAGVLVVVAGGNEDGRGQGNLDRSPAYPICNGGDGRFVLGVAATDRTGQKAPFSSFGKCVDLAAPGAHIAGTLFHDPDHVVVPLGGLVTSKTFSDAYGGFFNGTSFAAPLVSGAASLVRGILPSANPDTLSTILVQSADPITATDRVNDRSLGAGQLNLARAMNLAVTQANAQPDASLSSLSTDRTLLALGETVTVRVAVRSTLNTPMIGREVKLASLRASDVLSPAIAVTDANGIATVLVRATVEGVAEFRASIDGALLATGRAVFARATSEPIGPGTLLKGTTSTVYVVGSDDQRYAFPDVQTLQSWEKDTSRVQHVDNAVLAAFQLGGLITIRPGTFLVKITTDPRVYTVEPGGVLRWVETEQIASALYGDKWARRVVDVPDAFFATYQRGAPLAVAAYPSGALLEDDSGTRFYVDGTSARPFASILSFLKHGFQHRDVLRVTSVALSQGAPISETIEPAIAMPVP